MEPSKTVSQEGSLLMLVPDRHCSDGGTKETNLLSKGKLNQGQVTKRPCQGVYRCLLTESSHPQAQAKYSDPHECRGSKNSKE